MAVVCFFFIEGLTPAEFCIKFLATIKSEMESDSFSSVPEMSLILIKSWSWIDDWINEWNLHSYGNFHLRRTAIKLESLKKKSLFKLKIASLLSSEWWLIFIIYHSRRGKIRTQLKKSDSENIQSKNVVPYFSFWPLSCEIVVCTAS